MCASSEDKVSRCSGEAEVRQLPLCLRHNFSQPGMIPLLLLVTPASPATICCPSTESGGTLRGAVLERYNGPRMSGR